MGEGWSRGAPHDEVELLPLSDGGPGLPRRPRPGARRHHGRHDGERPARPRGARRRARRRARRAAHGLRRGVAGQRPAPARRRRARPRPHEHVGGRPAARGGLGEGAHKIVVGVGGSATNDAGAGMLAALGAGPASVLARGGLALAAAPDDALLGLPPGSSTGSRASTSCSPPTRTRRCSACRAPAPSRRRARAPRAEQAHALEARARPVHRRRRPVAADPARRPAERDAAPPRPRARRRGRRWPGLRAPRTRCPSRERRRGGAARVRRSGSRQPAATSSSPAPAGSTGSPCAARSSPAWRPRPSNRAPDGARRGRVPRRPARDDDARARRHLCRRRHRARGRGDGRRPGETLAAAHRAGGAHLVARPLSGSAPANAPPGLRRTAGPCGTAPVIRPGDVSCVGAREHGGRPRGLSTATGPTVGHRQHEECSP